MKKLTITTHCLRYTIAILSCLIVFASCSERSRDAASPQIFHVEPLPSVYIQYDSVSGIFRIGNELVERRISVNPEERRIYTPAFINNLSGRNYIKALSPEFFFRANGVELSGISGNFQYVNHETYGAGGVKGLVINLKTELERVGMIRLRLIYEIYSGMPIIRKWLEIENPGGSLVTIDSIQIESVSLMPGSEYDLIIDDNPQNLSPVVFNIRLSEGFFIGNEFPGLLKYSDIYSDSSYISIGMKPNSHKYAPEIQLAPGESFASPGVFIFPFKGEPDDNEAELREFIYDYIARSNTPEYSIWYESIMDGITGDKAVEKLQYAAASGADVFCLDGRWMDKRGNWSVAENVHISHLSQYATYTGVKLGLSIDLAIADTDSYVAAEYPRWIVKSQEGADYNAESGKLMCLGSEYAVYIAREIDRLVKELGLDYVRFTGILIPDDQSVGCFAKDHIHRSNAESLWYIYEGFFAICSYLHSQNPELIIDIKTESYDPNGVVDYALLKHVDVSLR
jgi:hypothetical protein